jgi:hypothetical protein
MDGIMQSENIQKECLPLLTGFGAKARNAVHKEK